jgi:hypothetical protein
MNRASEVCIIGRHRDAVEDLAHKLLSSRRFDVTVANLCRQFFQRSILSASVEVLYVRQRVLTCSALRTRECAHFSFGI